MNENQEILDYIKILSDSKDLINNMTNQTLLSISYPFISVGITIEESDDFTLIKQSIITFLDNKIDILNKQLVNS
jgi:hypothetical protein